MKKNVTYTWEAMDESLAFAEHAANRMANFHPLHDEKDAPANLKAYRRVVENGDSFTAEDVEAAAQYLETLAARAGARIDNLRQYITTPKCTPEELELANTFIVALCEAQRAGRDAGARLRDLFVNANAR